MRCIYCRPTYYDGHLESRGITSLWTECRFRCFLCRETMPECWLEPRRDLGGRSSPREEPAEPETADDDRKGDPPMHDDRYDDDRYYDRLLRKIIFGWLVGIAIGVVICTFILIPLLRALH